MKKNAIVNKIKSSLLVSITLLGCTFTINAPAVNLSPDGLGDAVLFPYYSAKTTWQTFIRLINTSDNAIAAKVRFREAANSREVLDFIVLMSPKDMWLGWTDAKALDGKPGMKSSDASCIIPLVGSSNNMTESFQRIGKGVIAAQFKDRAFAGNYTDGSTKSSLERIQEGHIEVIAIAEFPSGTDLYDAVEHENGMPESCTAAKKAFQRGRGRIAANNSLAANAYMINVAAGQGGAYNPTVLANFSSSILFSSSDAKPDMDSADPVSILLSANALTLANWNINNPALPNGNNNPDLFRKTYSANGQTTSVTGGVDAVSSVLMRSNIMNEWAAKSGGKAVKEYFTQWIVNFPTKHYYVDIDTHRGMGMTYPTLSCSIGNICLFDGDAYAPFSNRFQLKGASCESYQMQLWNREERKIDFTSPKPEAKAELCYETNVISFANKYSKSGLASSFDSVVPEIFLPTDNANATTATYGWANLSFTGRNAIKSGLISANGLTLNSSNSLAADLAGLIARINLPGAGDGQPFKAGIALKGLPVHGFMFSVYKTGASRNNHVAINQHKYKRNIYNILLDDNEINNINIGKPRLDEQGKPVPAGF